MRGKVAKQLHQHKADDKCQYSTHQAVNDPMSFSEPRFGHGPNNVPQHNHLRQIDAKSGHTQAGPPCGSGRMSLAVISLGRKMLHHSKQQHGHGHIVDADVTSERIDTLLPCDVEMALHQKLKQWHQNDTEKEEQPEFPAMLTRENRQSILVHVIAQEHIAVIIGKCSKHVVIVIGRLDKRTMLEWDKRRQCPQHQHHLYTTLADGIDALAHQWQSHIDDQQHLDIPQNTLNRLKQDGRQQPGSEIVQDKSMLKQINNGPHDKREQDNTQAVPKEFAA